MYASLIRPNSLTVNWNGLVLGSIAAAVNNSLASCSLTGFGNSVLYNKNQTNNYIHSSNFNVNYSLNAPNTMFLSETKHRPDNFFNYVKWQINNWFFQRCKAHDANINIWFWNKRSTFKQD